MSVPLLRAIRDAQRYGFAVGKVRVLQTRIFGAGAYERLLDAPTFSEQMRVLSDTIYGRYLEEAQTADDVEDGLERALDDFYRFLDDANLPESVVRFFRVRYDYANLRAVLKARALGVPLEEMLVGLGTVPAEEVAGPQGSLPEFLGTVAESLEFKEGEAAPSIEEIDAAVERALFTDMATAARASKSRSLMELTTLLTDIANARLAIRARRKGATDDEVIGMLLPGGSLTAEDLTVERSAQPLEELALILASRNAPGSVTAADFSASRPIDVVLDNLIARFVRRVRGVPFGPEPVIAYVMAREAEVVAVRTLLIGKLAGLDREALRRRLRDLSV